MQTSLTSPNDSRALRIPSQPAPIVRERRAGSRSTSRKLNPTLCRCRRLAGPHTTLELPWVILAGSSLEMRLPLADMAIYDQYISRRYEINDNVEKGQADEIPDSTGGVVSGRQV